MFCTCQEGNRFKARAAADVSQSPLLISQADLSHSITPRHEWSKCDLPVNHQHQTVRTKNSPNTAIGWVNVPPPSSRRTLTVGYTDKSEKELQTLGCRPFHSTFTGGACFHSMSGVTGSVRQVHKARDEPRAMPSLSWV